MSHQSTSPIEVAFNRIVKLEYVTQKLIERIQQLESDNKLLNEKVQKLSIPPMRQNHPQSEIKNEKTPKNRERVPDVVETKPSYEKNVIIPKREQQQELLIEEIGQAPSELNAPRGTNTSHQFRVSSSQYKLQTPYRPPMAKKSTVDVKSLFKDDDEDEKIIF